MDAPGHLLVDGYNLAHAWPEVRRLLGRNLDAGAARVVDRVRVIHDFLGWAVTVVFDGQGERLTLEHPDGQETLTVVFAAAGETADAVIERMLGRAPAGVNWRVATDDRALAQSALAAGAEVLSAAEMEAWTDRSERQARDWLRRRQARTEAEWRRPEDAP